MTKYVVTGIDVHMRDIILTTLTGCGGYAGNLSPDDGATVEVSIGLGI